METEIPKKSFLKKSKKIFLIICILLAILVVGFFSNVWYQRKQLKVKLGLASSILPFSDYSIEELKEIFLNPDYSSELENIPVTQTPEQTHAKFIKFLEAGDVDSAVDCCVYERERDFQRERLRGIKEAGNIPAMLEDISVIEKNFDQGISVVYLYHGIAAEGKFEGERVANLMRFLKTNDGVFMIEGF